MDTFSFWYLLTLDPSELLAGLLLTGLLALDAARISSHQTGCKINLGGEWIYEFIYRAVEIKIPALREGLYSGFKMTSALEMP